ncbi:MAG: dTDP-4-dehydrorhamnose reductase [Bacteroidaceae bacterium]|jgi:dTDP-4-dehydrorhamnose reductase|nr:dTDP-4-dehydrorhamnose reductase [Bacteroidaceae bacterium]
MNILVTGANGQLGNELRIVAKGSQDKYIFTDVTEASDESINMLRKLAGEDVRTDTVRLDITDLEAVRKMVSEQEVQVIVNCAAYTNVDKAEENYDLAELLNTKAVENLAVAMREVDGLLVHISTDYVFGAEPYNKPCTEEQQGTPTGVYGQTKLHGEQAIIRTGCKHVIIRTAWLYSEFGKNFVKTMLNFTATKPQLKVVFDQVGTPTYAYDLAQAIMVVLDDFKDAIIHGVASNYEKTGIYHFSNEGVTSWYDFTKLIAELAGNTACNIQPCHSDEFPSPVKRPAYSVLDKTKIKEVFGIKVPYWTDSLKKCLSTML